MVFRLVASEPRETDSGVPYDHIVWSGEFDELEYEHTQAVCYVIKQIGIGYKIKRELPPKVLN